MTLIADVGIESNGHGVHARSGPKFVTAPSPLHRRAPVEVTPPKCGHLDRSGRPFNPTISVVVPTLNESRNLPYALWRLPKSVTEVIVVDGLSSDVTIVTAAAMRQDVKVVHEPQPGKGAALRRGMTEATGDIIVMLDADGSADGAEIERFVDALLAGADFAKGSRFLAGGGSSDLTRIRRAGNKALTGLVNFICQTRFTDLCYGYNAFWRDCLDFVRVDVNGFEVETRLTMMVATAGLIIVEVPSWEYERVHGRSNLHAISDGIRVVRAVATTSAQLRQGLRTVRGTSTEPSSVFT
jgi:glycosyltransferase involved in cell wall biosynthesis